MASTMVSAITALWLLGWYILAAALVRAVPTETLPDLQGLVGDESERRGVLKPTTEMVSRTGL
ncbi:MAG: hypothetical protein RBJ76_13525 [Stenomitos frigidus ULC029]